LIAPILASSGVLDELAVALYDHLGVAVSMTRAIQSGFSPQLRAMVAKLCLSASFLDTEDRPD